MTEDAKEQSGWNSVLLWGAVLVVVYVLSIGPVAAMDCGGLLPLGAREVLELVYAPLIWLCDNTPLDGPLEAYVELWCGR